MRGLKNPFPPAFPGEQESVFCWMETLIKNWGTVTGREDRFPRRIKVK